MLLFAALMSGMTTGTVFADPDTLTYRDRRGEPPATAVLVREYRQLSPLRSPAWKELNASWSFALGDPKEGLNTALTSLPETREPIKLPHRTLNADTPYWYVTDVAFSTPAVLDIHADDGAQLYVDGKRIPVRGDHFYVPAASGKVRLVVRVLNKAMYGGLAAVRIASQQDYERYRKEAELRARLAALVRKVRLLLAPKPEQIEAVNSAVRKPSEATLAAAQKQLSNLPLTLTGPYLQNAGPDRVTIVWETDEPCNAKIEWGEGYALTRKSPAQNEGNLHWVELTSLKPGANYSYRVHSGPVTSAQYTFRTLPADSPFEFTVWADSQNRWDIFRQNVNAMRRLPLAFTVGVGDLVEDAHHQEPWQGFFETLTPLASEVPAMLVGGNHDYDGCFEDLRSPFFERYARSRPKAQYFAWTAGNARFVALDPNPYYPTGIPSDSEQYRWFLKELESPEWKRATWHFIFIHQPPYSQGWAEYEGDLPLRAMFDPLMEKYQIDFIVSGHTHDYERWTKTYGSHKAHLFIVGGAGGGLEDEPMSAFPVMDKVIRRHHFGHFRIDGNKVTFEAVATDTHILDRFEVTK